MLWARFNNRYYKYVATRMTWADAELYCVSQGANLVSIHSLDEENFVKTLIKSIDHAEGGTWIGLSDLHKAGRWMWSDGCAVKFTFWLPGQPNNLSVQNCGYNNYYTDKKWNDNQCTDRLPSVCASRIMCP